MPCTSNPAPSTSFHGRSPSRASSVAARWTSLFLLLAAQVATASQEKLAASIGSTRDEVIATRDQLQTTVDTLAALAKQKQGDLKPAYDAFVKEVARTQANAALTTRRAESMQTEAQSHFDAWQRELEGVSNLSLRKKGQKRLDAVRKSYDRAAATLGSAGRSFGPYLSDLNDIQKILANDLTPGGVRSIRSTVSKAKFDLGIVRGHLYDTIRELDKMQKSLSSTVGGATSAGGS